jgi:SAM-dependent methyltransferase
VQAAGLPCLLVDDGSHEACATVLRSLAQRQGVDLLRLDINQGKGGAMLAGFAEAAARGYSHVFQIDADGQHDTADLPRFVEAARARFPGLDVRLAAAEDLPFADDVFDAALAQLVVHFMEDPVAGLREMGRVTTPGGLVSACVWDLAGDRSPLSAFWSVVRELDPTAVTESGLAGARSGQLVELATAAGLADPIGSTLTVTVAYADFDDWWEPYLLGVGPAGTYLARADEPRREAIRERCREVLPDGPFDVVAHAWCVHATVS